MNATADHTITVSHPIGAACACLFEAIAACGPLGRWFSR